MFDSHKMLSELRQECDCGSEQEKPCGFLRYYCCISRCLLWRTFRRCFYLALGYIPTNMSNTSSQTLPVREMSIWSTTFMWSHGKLWGSQAMYSMYLGFGWAKCRLVDRLFWCGEPSLELYWSKAHRNRMPNSRFYLRKCSIAFLVVLFLERIHACRLLGAWSLYYENP